MKRVVLGVSGGVDSSVAAYILKQQGYDVIGLFMKNWQDDDDGYCTVRDDYLDAKSVCLKLGIPCYSVNFTQEYWDNVFSVFLEEYKKGRTPNPDILCNSEIKFKCFLNYARENFDAEYIATGHYARNDYLDGRPRLLKGADPNKDQSYFLSFLRPEQIKGALFPIGGMLKSQVRQIAADLNLRTASKKDSTGICFIGERNFRNFLSNYLPAQKGDIVDADTHNKIGTHNGLMYYTIGQRRGLGIGNIKEGQRWFVCGKDIKNNILYAAEGADNPLLYKKGFICTQTNFIKPLKDRKYTLNVKYRYRQDEKPCVVKINGSKIECIFDTPQSGVAPGQTGAFYDGEELVCAGIIDNPLD